MKKVLIGVVGLGLIIVGGLFFVLSNLDGMVKDAIQVYGSDATKTRVTVSDVKIVLEDGKASISGLNVGNPAGFSDPNIFELGNITTNIDTSTIRQNPIVIDEILISAPAVVYEINKAGVSNVDVLKKSLGSGGSSSSSSSSSGEELKMIIKRLVVEGSTAKVRIAALGDQQQTVKLPKIVMRDVGQKSGGATAAEVAQQLSSKLLGNVKGSVARLGVNKYLGKSADAFKTQALDKVGGAGGAVGGGAGGALKGLLGK
ncbi:hypothetical protein MMIC_P0832 [Mariprofundus micogutta]|uniref:AsmA family protein n=1 Tax=Mariprofundus micogutta TaxID=1921010 RepID=A0A1L8CLU0_9PROT|nr:hypothetical protein [Mariprofundus micogutta]GAV19874.1 hypothetical protein MMIC_P0832 [Mariprofundus micogutta]